MTTVVNNPTPSGESGGGGLVAGILALVVVLVLLAYFGLPLFNMAANKAGSGGGTQIEIPEQVDINVNQGQPGQ